MFPLLIYETVMFFSISSIQIIEIRKKPNGKAAEKQRALLTSLSRLSLIPEQGLHHFDDAPPLKVNCWSPGTCQE